MFLTMTCVTNLDLSLASTITAALWVICAAILAWVAYNSHFAGKHAFALTLASMLWWLFAVGFDLASPSESCKIFWSLMAWPGITLVPVAWSFFLFDYTMNTRQHPHPYRRLLYIGLPCIVGLIAATNSQTHMLYGTETHLVTQDGNSYVVFDHGPLFYTVASVLYIFVTAGMGVVIYAHAHAKRIIRPFLRVLFIITAAPLAANVAYVVWGFTVFGFDPTPFMFAVALIALSWLLLNNMMMDTATQGRNLLFYAKQDPVLIIDASRRLAGSNPAAKTLFKSNLLQPGKKLTTMGKFGPKLNDLIETSPAHPPDPIRTRGRIFEPRVLPIESPIQNKRPLLGWSISLLDITDRETSAEALREALARAEEANHAKSQFLAMISHELRTPMTSVKGGLDLALHGVVGDIDEPLRNLLTIAQRNSLRLLKLVDDVLDLQKLDLGTIALDLQDIDADTFLRDIIEEYEAFAGKTNVRLVNASKEVGKHLCADLDRLKQVIGNVISNAVKFSPHNGEVTLSTQVLGNHLRVSVTDTGIGIPAGKEDQVFGRFHQVQSDSFKASGGSGLGLHIAKILIERMNGAITYDSTPGQGTTFRIDVPIAA